VIKVISSIVPVKCALSFVFVDKVCEYFGVKIGMYFTYLGHYTAALLWPAFLGTMFWLLSGSHQVVSHILCWPFHVLIYVQFFFYFSSYFLFFATKNSVTVTFTQFLPVTLFSFYSIVQLYSSTVGLYSMPRIQSLTDHCTQMCRILICFL